jgi:RNA polymerase sigma-70 factor (ECF subfamily)
MILEAGRRGKLLRDTLLVQRILEGDREAGERFVTDHYPRILRMLRHLSGSVEAAEDLAQQTFLKGWQALGAFRGEASLATWLHRIAYHEYTHWLRGRREHAPLEEAAEVADRRAECAFEAVLVRRALAQLSPEHRDTFILFHVEGFSVPEVAVILGVPPGTIKSRLFAARRRLREYLQDAVPTPFPERPRAAMSKAQPRVEEMVSP